VKRARPQRVPPTLKPLKIEKLKPRFSVSEFQRLTSRLGEAEEALRAIRTGEVDAVVVAGKGGLQVFTLQGANHAYRVLIESMNEGALTLTADKLILYANECFARMVKCPLEQVAGSSFRRFLSAADRATLKPLMRRARKSGSKIQVSLRAGDGSKMPAQISIRPLAKNGGNPAAVGMVVTDLTEARRAASQKQTERLYAQAREHADQLERRVDERTGQLLIANQELEAFQSAVSHDLRAPLRHLIGFSQILIETCAPQLPEQARAYLNRIHDGAGKMECMIVALLEFSRLGKQSLSLQSVDVSQMCHDILAEMRPEIGGRRADVTIGKLPPCHADPALLRQVLVNLLGNALKYSRTRERPVIEISSFAPPDGRGTAYAIKDNGVGFDMANAGKLFTVFARLHADKDFEGTGVGLTTVQRIIQRHGGRIWAESAPGVGATFFFIMGPPPSNPVHGAAARDVKTGGRVRK
jgi:PAS domain S-box-containing protein